MARTEGQAWMDRLWYSEAKNTLRAALNDSRQSTGSKHSSRLSALSAFADGSSNSAALPARPKSRGGSATSKAFEDSRAFLRSTTPSSHVHAPAAAPAASPPATRRPLPDESLSRRSSRPSTAASNRGGSGSPVKAQIKDLLPLLLELEPDEVLEDLQQTLERRRLARANVNEHESNVDDYAEVDHWREEEEDEEDGTSEEHHHHQQQHQQHQQQQQRPQTATAAGPTDRLLIGPGDHLLAPGSENGDRPWTAEHRLGTHQQQHQHQQGYRDDSSTHDDDNNAHHSNQRHRSSSTSHSRPPSALPPPTASEALLGDQRPLPLPHNQSVSRPSTAGSSEKRLFQRTTTAPSSLEDRRRHHRPSGSSKRADTASPVPENRLFGQRTATAPTSLDRTATTAAPSTALEDRPGSSRARTPVSDNRRPPSVQQQRPSSRSSTPFGEPSPSAAAAAAVQQYPKSAANRPAYMAETYSHRQHSTRAGTPGGDRRMTPEPAGGDSSSSSSNHAHGHHSHSRHSGSNSNHDHHGHIIGDGRSPSLPSAPPAGVQRMLENRARRGPKHTWGRQYAEQPRDVGRDTISYPVRGPTSSVVTKKREKEFEALNATITDTMANNPVVLVQDYPQWQTTSRHFHSQKPISPRQRHLGRKTTDISLAGPGIDVNVTRQLLSMFNVDKGWLDKGP